MADLYNWWNSRHADGLRVFLWLLVWGAGVTGAIAVGASISTGTKSDCSAFTVSQYQTGDVPVRCAEEQ